MKNRKNGIAILCLLGLAFAAPGWAQEKPLSLTLEDSIVKALKNNLALAVQVLAPEISGAALTQAKEMYYPSLSLGFKKQNQNSASYSFLDASDAVRTAYDDYSLSLNQTIPMGGSVSVSVDSNRNDSNRNFQTINPRYGSTLNFSFSQPLLKGFGWKTSRRQILLAQNNLDISRSNLEKTLMDTIYSVEEAYWNLVYSIQSLNVSRKSLQLAKDLLEKNRRSVEVGKMAPIDILSAQAEVATREADILSAEALVKNNEDRLKTIMNISQEEEKMFTSIVPEDVPVLTERSISLDEALATALANRPDLRSSKIGLKNDEINLSYARNQLLPGLDLVASYWSPGMSGTQIIYRDNNPLSGDILMTIPGRAGDALKDAFNFKYKNWSLGLTLSVPVANVFSKAAYIQARLNMDQALLEVKNQEKQLVLEIKTAVRTVETNFKRVQAYKAARELAEQKLAAEEEKLKVGLSTNYLVLQYQRDLATARNSELKAVVDASISLAGLDRSLGVSLKNRNMTVAGLPDAKD